MSAGNPHVSNMQIRQLVLAKSVKMLQQINTQTVYPSANPVLNIPVRPVGLVLRLWIEVIATLTPGAAAATLTDTGVGNLLQQVTLADLNNFTRIQTTGQHLTLLSCLKRRRPLGSTADFNVTTGNNASSPINTPPALWGVWQAPGAIAANTAGTVRAVFEVPLAYSDDDLRGAIYANVINATMQLGLTLNQNAIVGNGDYTNAVYQTGAATAGAFTQATVNVYQEYLDQLPVANGQVLLPPVDMATMYELKNTNMAALTPGQDFYIPFSNFRDYHSTILIYNNSGGAAGRALGTDINYLALQASNMTAIEKIDPLFKVLKGRETMQQDLPAGFYYNSYRRKPISTQQFGAMNIVLNPITAAAGAYVNVYWEDLGLTNMLTGAPALASS